MSSFDVIALRSICAAHYEVTVAPLLKELRCEVASLAAAKEQRLTIDAPTLARFEDLVAEVGRKACSDSVPTLVQHEELRSLVASKAAIEDVPTCARFDDLVAEVDRKAGKITLPSITELRAELAEDVAKWRSHQQLEDELRLEDLRLKLELKANIADVPKRCDIEKLLSEQKDSADALRLELLSSRALDTLWAKLHLKANAAAVPTLDQFQELCVSVRTDYAGARALTELEKLEDTVRKHTSELELKADSKNIMAELARKANVKEVPSLTLHKEHASSVEKKLTFLARKAQQQSNQQPAQGLGKLNARATSFAPGEWCQPPMVWCVPPYVDAAWAGEGCATWIPEAYDDAMHEQQAVIKPLPKAADPHPQLDECQQEASASASSSEKGTEETMPAKDAPVSLEGEKAGHDFSSLQQSKGLKKKKGTPDAKARAQ